ncbi:hypothetical protein EGW08_017718 [Elysia chlorotica]|uniref:Uncharacterized protein n=1 Tax=Elysia chlorotica TaxID=188477 RepID=A0A3S0ZSZ5_ELYCH|nr:hypothetical protein EGW08_017718 [Elysia chlorotica]
MRISPVLNPSMKADNEQLIKGYTSTNMAQDLKIGFIVELDSTLERRFFCPSLKSRLQDCRLEGCAQGALLWTHHLPQGQAARRFCIAPAVARVLHAGGSSQVPLCVCLATMSVLKNFGLWDGKIVFDRAKQCSFSLHALKIDQRDSFDEIYDYDRETFNQLTSDDLVDRLVKMLESCPEDGQHKFQICFIPQGAAGKSKLESNPCLTWGTNAPNGTPASATRVWISTLVSLHCFLFMDGFM